MGWSFRKSFKIMPGVRLNLSRKGVGASFGVKGLHLGVGSGRRPRLTGGVGPLHYYQSLGGKRAGVRPPPPPFPTNTAQPAGSGPLRKILVACCILFGVGVVAHSLSSLQPAVTSPRPLSPSAPSVDVPGTASVPATAPLGTAAPAPVKATSAAAEIPASTSANQLRPSQPTPLVERTAAVPNEPAYPAQGTFQEKVAVAQRIALMRYPELGKAGSPFNRTFLREYTRLKVAGSAWLADFHWPVWLAGECAARIKNPALGPIDLRLAPTDVNTDASYVTGTSPASDAAQSASPTSGYSPDPSGGDAVYVHGYYRKNGTYVQPYTRGR
jgi:hypothetical protein